ncbi:MAG: hypothetical protein ACU0BS_06210 [Hasllibacter sp.]
MRMTDGTIREGVWSARFQADAAPEGGAITVVMAGRELAHSVARIEGDLWEIRVPIPAEVIAEGTRTAVVSDPDGRRLAHFTLISGEDAGEDLRAELDLLRAELDMLKRAFRRHCLETAG